MSVGHRKGVSRSLLAMRQSARTLAYQSWSHQHCQCGITIVRFNTLHPASCCVGMKHQRATALRRWERCGDRNSQQSSPQIAYAGYTWSSSCRTFTKVHSDGLQQLPLHFYDVLPTST